MLLDIRVARLMAVLDVTALSNIYYILSVHDSCVKCGKLNANVLRAVDRGLASD